MKRTSKHQFFFAHPPEVVWEYLTNPDLIHQWLMKNTFQPILGFDFQFQTNPIPALNFDGMFYCKVLEIVPAKKLAYSWKSGPGDGKITLESIVEWTLHPKEKGTDVFLEHSGFDKDENLDFFNGLNHGWIEKLQNIENLLNASGHGEINA